MPLKDKNNFSNAYKVVSEERRRKIDSFHFEKDKCLSLGAEILLQHALKKASINPEKISIKLGKTGKPYLENSNLFFNISHSGDWVICAVSNKEIGCDIEKIESADLQIAQKFFNPKEYAHIAEQKSADEQKLLFYRYWTLKESFIKNTGLGLSQSLDSFQIELGEKINISQNFSNQNYSFAEFHNIPGYCCSVCFLGSKPEIQIFEIS